MANNEWGDSPVVTASPRNDWGDEPALGVSPYSGLTESEQVRSNDDFLSSMLSKYGESTGPSPSTLGKRQGYVPSTMGKLALRVGVPLLAGVSTGGLGLLPAIALTGGTGLATEAAAEGLEILGGEREKLSPSEIIATGALNAVPGIPLNRLASPLLRGGIRATEGALLGGAHPVIESGLRGELPGIKEVGEGTLYGGLFGVPFGGIEALSAMRQRTMARPSQPNELAVMGDAFRDAGLPIPSTGVLPDELQAIARASSDASAERAGAAMAGGTVDEVRIRRLAERMAGVVEPEAKLQILDQEVKLAGDELSPVEQRGALDLKQQLEQQIEAGRMAEQQAKEAERIAKEQQKAQAEAQKAAEQAMQPPEIPKSAQILAESATPPSIANVATEIGTQTSPFALQGKLNEMTALPAQPGEQPNLAIAPDAVPAPPAVPQGDILAPAAPVPAAAEAAPTPVVPDLGDQPVKFESRHVKAGEITEIEMTAKDAKEFVDSRIEVMNRILECMGA